MFFILEASDGITVLGELMHGVGRNPDEAALLDHLGLTPQIESKRPFEDEEHLGRLPVEMRHGPGVPGLHGLLEYPDPTFGFLTRDLEEDLTIPDSNGPTLAAGNVDSWHVLQGVDRHAVFEPDPGFGRQFLQLRVA